MTSKNYINYNKAERYVQCNNQIKKRIQWFTTTDQTQQSGKGFASMF